MAAINARSCEAKGCRVACTNIEIDDELAMKRSGAASLGRRPLSRQEALALEGSGWEGELEELRRVRGEG
ncbi:MAG TPA: hypothetical protein VHF27_06950 [Acidimicrobiales bacterium]|nr:hypothetical protein [Acidimicrobiales bacterium]